MVPPYITRVLRRAGGPCVVTYGDIAMYDLDTRGRLEIRSYENFSPVRILAEDVSIREAFPIAGALAGDEGFIHFIVDGAPYPDDFGSFGVEHAFVLQYDDDNTADLPCFAGDESGWSPYDEDEADDFQWSVVWVDGGRRDFCPCD